MLKEERGETGQGSWQELAKCCRYRVEVCGYPAGGWPQDTSMSVWVAIIIPISGEHRQKRYRLFGKGRRFVRRMEIEQPELTSLWCLELSSYWKQLKEIKEKIAIGRKNWIRSCIQRGVKPKGVTPRELKEVMSEVVK